MELVFDSDRKYFAKTPRDNAGDFNLFKDKILSFYKSCPKLPIILIKIGENDPDSFLDRRYGVFPSIELGKIIWIYFSIKKFI